MLYHVCTLHDALQKVSPKWLSNQTGNTVCSSCFSPLPHVESLDVMIREPVEDVPLNRLDPIRCGIIRLDLMSAFGEEAFHECFFVGQILDEEGGSIDDFFTFRGRSDLLIRGNRTSTHRVCDACGTLFYHPMGSCYVLESQLLSHPMCESQFKQIIANESVATAIRNEAWESLAIEGIAMRGLALDGFDI